MQFFVKELFKKFHELPEKFPPKHYPYFVFANYAFLMAGTFHFAFIFVFAFLGIKILSIYNLLSTLIWAFCIYLNLKGMRSVHLLLANIELLLHASLCVVILGWDSGFHYFLLSVPLVIFLSAWSNYKKLLVCTFNGVAYVLLYYYSNIATPQTILNPTYVNWFNSFNSIGIIFAISYCAYYYRFMVLSVEKKLEIEHQRTVDVLNRLNEDLSDAADYVRKILPEPNNEGPVHSNWKFIPSASLGGDAFGYQWLDKDNFAMYLLDVSGHGVGAALLSATIMNVLRSHALPWVDFSEPDQVLSALNRSFPGEENNDMFFTIWYGVYNKSMQYLTYSSGGHPPAILISDSSKRNTPFDKLRTPNFVVGGKKKATYKKNVHNVKDPSCLYLFSDGVYEFIQCDGSRWRYNEFVNFLCELHTGDDTDIDRLVKSAKDLNQSKEFEDDFTIMKISFQKT
ncbi:MAG: SpoIIE family protein phosphatase [Deltaproteobacteria bacterium]|nr:SpoIIE family protein phosphatase [Deltaproteobacteria bacterium]